MGRRQPKPEPFSLAELEEIAQSPALQGFEKVLQYRPVLVESLSRTVNLESSSTVEGKPSTTVDDVIPSTVVPGSSSTVESESTSTVRTQRPAYKQDLWIADGAGGVFSSSRIKRIQQAQDALTHVEEAVYDALWGPKKKDQELYRLAQIGYSELARRSRVSKRSIQSVIERLIEKEFIRIEKPPDISRRQSTVYRVLGYTSVLSQMRDRGRQFVVRTGKGVFYACPWSMAPASTVEVESPSTVEAGSHSTVETPSPVSMEATSTSTVEAASTDTSLGITQGKTSSSVSMVASRIVKLMAIDDDAVRRLIENCRRNDTAATDDEIAYCAETWIKQNSRSTSIRKPVAVLLTAVPKYFQEPATELTRYRKQKADETEQTKKVARTILEDPAASEKEREWAYATLGHTSDIASSSA